jgi:hypothetical protein
MAQSRVPRRRIATSRPSSEGDVIASAALRDGPRFRDGIIIRVFAPRRVRGYSPAAVGEMLRAAINRARDLLETPTLIVMPAGVGSIEDLGVTGEIP